MNEIHSSHFCFALNYGVFSIVTGSSEHRWRYSCSRRVLTAAHCAPTTNLSLATFIVEGGGSGRVTDLKLVSKVKSFYTHPKYLDGKKADWDIAVVELEQEIQLNDELVPLKMKDLKDVTLLKSDNVTIGGWGF